MSSPESRTISDATAARIGLVVLMVLSWYVARKHSQLTLAQNSKRLKGNAYGMWLLMLMTSARLFLFAVLVAICATTAQEVFLLVYVDRETEKERSGGPKTDRLQYRSFLAFLTDVAFYRCVLAAIATCILLATVMIFCYDKARGRASTEDYAKEALPYPEFYVLLYLDISSALILAWLVYYMKKLQT
jgi:hypothetical protein